MSSAAELLQRVKASIREVSAAELAAELGLPAAPLLVDVREREEWQEGALPGAVHIPRGFLETRIESLAPDRDRPLVLYCASGVRSAYAARTLSEELGYTDVRSLAGGYSGWKDQDQPVEHPFALSPEQHARYARHLRLPELGEQGQVKLLQARVLLLGAGGLGSPAALYLAAAGVGTLAIVDSDMVELSNLQRQVIHSSERIGEPKTSSAAAAIHALNPEVNVVEHNLRLERENILEIIAGYDVIVDGLDNFPTRYLLNDASVRLGIPVVSASILGFEGQLSVFAPGDGPCYRCLYPSPPPPELAPTCGVAGVLGVLPGTLGLLQATEVIKLICGIGRPLVGRLLLYDALESEFTELRAHRDPDCPICSLPADELAALELPDYVEFCRL